jgi:hypothetical protein
MTNLQRRLRKLERALTDSSGLIPNSPRWLAYWQERIPKILNGEVKERMPLEAVRAWVVNSEDTDSAGY